MALDFTNLNNALADHTAEVDDAVAALKDIAGKVGSGDTSQADQDQLNAIADKLAASTAELKDGVSASDPGFTPPPIPAPANGSEASTSNNATVPSTPVDTTPVATQPVVTAVGKPLYEHVGGSEVDGASWPNSGLTTPDGTPLYYFAGDVPGGAASGASNDWQLYTGAVQQNAANPLVDNTAATLPESGQPGAVTVAQTSEPSTAPVTTGQVPEGEGGAHEPTNDQQLASSTEVTPPAQAEGVSGAGTDGPATGASV